MIDHDKTVTQLKSVSRSAANGPMSALRTQLSSLRCHGSADSHGDAEGSFGAHAFAACLLVLLQGCGGMSPNSDAPNVTDASALMDTVEDTMRPDSGTQDSPDPPAVDAPNADAPQSDSAGAGCALTANTSPSGVVTTTCELLNRDTSSCEAARRAMGLSGAWLKFSCRVSLTNMAAGATPYVVVAGDSQPDYRSNYFQQPNPCYAAYNVARANPNHIVARSVMMRIPLASNMTSTRMGLGPVGIALNGVAIFNNQAAPGDDIFRETGFSDRCAGHPAPDGLYHYHGEPYALSYDDSRLIGVLRDGYFVYGRRDMDGSMPTLDSNGGHVGVTADSAMPIYHYHVNEQVSTTPGTAGERQWFLTTGSYRGVPLN
jgi:hypothetical protein